MITKKLETIPCQFGHCKYNCTKLYEYNPLLNDEYVSSSKGRKHRIILIDEKHSYIYVLEHHILLWIGYDIPHWKLKKELKNYEQYIKTKTILE